MSLYILEEGLLGKIVNTAKNAKMVLTPKINIPSFGTPQIPLVTQQMIDRSNLYNGHKEMFSKIKDSGAIKPDVELHHYLKLPQSAKNLLIEKSKEHLVNKIKNSDAHIDALNSHVKLLNDTQHFKNQRQSWGNLNNLSQKIAKNLASKKEINSGGSTNHEDSFSTYV